MEIILAWLKWLEVEMAKRRPLTGQFHYIINQSTRFGHKRRAEKKNGVKVELYIYSNKSCSRMRDFCKGFAKFLKENYNPRMVRDIDSDMAREWFKSKLGAGDWNISTARQRYSDLKKLECMAAKVFNLKDFKITDFDFKELLENGSMESKSGRKLVAMKEEDFSKLQAYVLSHNSCAKLAVSICALTGLRAEEVSSLKPDEIDLENGLLYVNNPKGGRERTVDISSDIDFFKWAVDYAVSHGWETMTVTNKVGSLQSAVRRALKACDLDHYKQGIHSIRKMFAVRKMRETGGSWNATSRALGHGSPNGNRKRSNARSDLKKIYLKQDDDD